MPDPAKNRSKRKPSKAQPQAAAGDSSLVRQVCQESGMPLAGVLDWKAYPDRLVILFKTGQKIIRRLP